MAELQRSPRSVLKSPRSLNLKKTLGKVAAEEQFVDYENALTPTAANYAAQETREAFFFDDDKINMSVIFDDKTDDISRVITFDNHERVESPRHPPVDVVLEKSLEITYDDYVEYETLKKKWAEEAANGKATKKASPKKWRNPTTNRVKSDASVQFENIRSLEITYDDYLEYEKLKKKWAEENGEVEPQDELPKDGSSVQSEASKELQTGRHMHRVVSKQLSETPMSKLEQVKHEYVLYEIEKELDDVCRLKKKMEEEKRVDKIRKAQQELYVMIKALSKVERPPVKETVEERMKSHVDLYKERVAESERIASEFAAHKAKADALNKDPEKVLLAHEDLRVPPPVKHKLIIEDYSLKYTTKPTEKEYLKLKMKHMKAEDERKKVKNSPKAQEIQEKKKPEKKSDRKDDAKKMLSQASKPVFYRPDHRLAPRKTPIVKQVQKHGIWTEVQELAKDLQYTFKEKKDSIDESDESTTKDDDGQDDTAAEKTKKKEKSKGINPFKKVISFRKKEAVKST